jgi:recombination protein RecA
MASLAVIRAQVESRLPGALTVYERSAPEVFPTGIATLDQQIRGIPQGMLTQIHATQDMSSGKTTLLISLMAQLTRRDQFCALVDASDCFDPKSAETAGVNLSRVLWVRCGEKQRLKPLEQAFKAADILVQNGGFGLIAVDLGNIEEKLVRKVPLLTWFRFARVVEKMPTALVFLTTFPAAQSCAGLTLHLAGAEPCWATQGKISHGRLLAKLDCEVEIRKPVQSAKPRFPATPIWA